MDKLLYYLILAGSVGIMFLSYFLIRKYASKKLGLFNKLFAWVIFILMFVWELLCGGGVLRDVLKFTYNTPFVNVASESKVGLYTGLSLYSMWFFIIPHIIALVSPLFEFKIIHRLERLLSPVLLLYCVIVLPLSLYGYCGTYALTPAGILYTIELGFLVGKVINLWVFQRISLKMNKQEIIEFVLFVVGLFLFTIPEFLPKAVLGIPKQLGQTTGFATFHRYYIYAAFIFLIGMSLLLRNHKGEYARMVMLLIAYAGMIVFSIGYSFRIFITPYDWPLHVCNTAMFILPIALVTKSEKVFYFTFFVNILGAMIATFMPVYDDSHYWYSTRVFGFFVNHILAMAGPLICVLTGIFSRPKKRQFFYSMVGFTVYFLIAFTSNTIFSTIWPEQDIDFFFLNSNFIVDKIGAPNLFEKFRVEFMVKDKLVVMHPLYDVLFYLGFVILSIGMWYVYVWLFKFQDHLIYLNERHKKIKLDAIALEVKCGQKEVKECMNPESVNKLVISHFGKRYSEKAPFAVRDINFVANSGEIIGFLGPNGAGKSTTIKAIVGIHLPTEGSIEVNGYDVTVQPVEAKAQLGFVPDHYALYENLTGREYLNYIADLYDVSKTDRDAFLDEYLETLNMKDAIDNKIQTYSHGMKQKIAIMASIIHNPKLWILDEPLTGLDPVSIYQVKQCLKKHADNGNIVFFSSHLIDIVEKLCDRIVIISDHKVVDVANVKDLLKKGVNLEQYYMEKTGLATGN